MTINKQSTHHVSKLFLPVSYTTLHSSASAGIEYADLTSVFFDRLTVQVLVIQYLMGNTLPQSLKANQLWCILFCEAQLKQYDQLTLSVHN